MQQDNNGFSFVETLVQELCETPESILLGNQEFNDKIKLATKCLFDKEQSFKQFGPLPELVVSGFDCEQIWQELKLMNEPFEDYLREQFDNIDITSTDEEDEDVAEEYSDEEEELEEDQEDEEDFDSQAEYDEDDIDDQGEYEEEMEDEIEADMEEEAVVPKQTKDSKKELNISLKDVYEMALEAEKLDHAAEDALDDEEAALLYDDLDEEDEEDFDPSSLKYDDFFAPSKKIGSSKRSKSSDDIEMEDDEEEEDLEDVEMDVEEEKEPVGSGLKTLFNEDSEDDEENKVSKSAYEKDQERMSKIIADLEDENVKTKEWTLRGEVASKARPVNSLLEENLEFENVGKSAPLITEEVTETLEEMIKRRILDKAFNDVERKLEKSQVFLKKENEEIEIQDEKNSESLAQVYETALQNKLSGKDNVTSKKAEVIEKERQAIKEEMQTIFQQLDALTNFNFTPKMPEINVQVIKNVASVEVEEIIPATMSQASRLAPQEIFQENAMVKGHAEKSSKEKQVERSKKKRQKSAEKDAKLTPEEREKQAALKTLSNSSNVTFAEKGEKSAKYSNSSFVFQELNNASKGDEKSNINSAVKSKSRKGGKEEQGQLSAARFKL